MREGDKPWWVGIVRNGMDKQFWHSTHLMKTFYFLARDFSDKVNVGWIDASDEPLVEIFENDGLPINFYIKDGLVYH